MSNRKRRRSNAITAQKPATTPTGITSTPPPPLTAPPTSDPSAKWRWLIFGVLVLGLVAGWGLYAASEYGVWPFPEREKKVDRVKKVFEKEQQAQDVDLMSLLRKVPPRKPWKIEPWKAVTDEDRVIDQFVTMHRKGDGTAVGMLAEIPAGDAVIDEDEFERRVAGYYLRHKGVTIRDIFRGEPDGERQPKPTPGRYTLVTRSQGSFNNPTMNVRDAKGNLSAPSYSLLHPFIVVEVKDKSIQPLRAEANASP